MKKTNEMTSAKAVGQTIANKRLGVGLSQEDRAGLAAKNIKKNERFLTVSIYPDARQNVPWIRLRGLWLLQAGFIPQTRIRVRVMSGCLVITKE